MVHVTFGQCGNGTIGPRDNETFDIWDLGDHGLCWPLFTHSEPLLTPFFLPKRNEKAFGRKNISFFFKVHLINNHLIQRKV
jgi:hypothetical protein